LNTPEKFWLIMFGGNATIFLAYQTSMTGIFQGLCLAGAVAFSVILCVTVFYYLYGVELDDILRAEEINPPAKTAKKRIAAPDAVAWIEKLQKAVAEKDLYKDPNLKLGDLAQKINISGHQLSELLNDHLGKNFSTYINEYRINEACKLILSDGRLSIEAIGYEVGYNSKSTFYAAFKKIKDMTPALFKESMEKV
jgi:AraC-like DNA-binding protein